MQKYAPGDDVGPLEFWPFDSPASAYQIVEGEPKTYGRIDLGGPGHTTRQGIWRCTAGAFECTEQGDELMTVLSGHGRLVGLDGVGVQDLTPGHTLFIRDGSRVRWEIFEDLTKVFFAHKADGY